MEYESTCNRCGTALDGSRYEIRLSENVVYRCLRCALMYWPTVRRSILILIIGTLLTAINQGTVIARGDLYKPGMAGATHIRHPLLRCHAGGYPQRSQYGRSDRRDVGTNIFGEPMPSHEAREGIRG